MDSNQKTSVNVGISEATVAAARDTIMDILNVDCEQKTIRQALKTLNTICEVKNTTISNCTFTA